MNADKIMRLVDEYGYARFDCGVCDPGKKSDALYVRAAKKMDALESAVRELERERDYRQQPLRQAIHDSLRAEIKQADAARKIAEAECERLRGELLNFAQAKRFDRSVFASDTEFADWVQSRCRHEHHRSSIDAAIAQEAK